MSTPDVFNLPKELLKLAEEELNETPERRTAALAELKQLVSTWTPAERQQCEQDAYLLSYLRPCKYNVDKAAEKIKNMLKYKEKHAEILKDVHGEMFRDFYQQNFLKILNGRGKDGASITALLPQNLQDIPNTDVFAQWNVWSVERMLQDPYLQVCGAVMIETFENFTFMDMIKMSRRIPSKVQQSNFEFMEKCVPFRFKGIYILHEPTFMRWLWAMVRPFMSKKMQERIHLLGKDVAALHKIIDPAHLPAEFGGTLVEEPKDSWFERQLKLETAVGPEPTS